MNQVAVPILYRPTMVLLPVLSASVVVDSAVAVLPEEAAAEELSDEPEQPASAVSMVRDRPAARTFCMDFFMVFFLSHLWFVLFSGW